MRLGVLFSGGKDSCLALHHAMQEHEVVCIITIVSENPESYMFHTPNIGLVELQAEAVGLPLVLELTKGEKEEELEDLRRAIEEAVSSYSIEGVATGAIASEYQRSRVAAICDGLGLACVNPLWGRDQFGILEEVIELGFETIISGVFAYPFDESWLGRRIDKQCLEELAELNEKFMISPSGEGGEIETTVLDALFFEKRIVVEESSTSFSGNSGVFRIEKVSFMEN